MFSPLIEYWGSSNKCRGSRRSPGAIPKALGRPVENVPNHLFSLSAVAFKKFSVRGEGLDCFKSELGLTSNRNCIIQQSKSALSGRESPGSPLAILFVL